MTISCDGAFYHTTNPSRRDWPAKTSPRLHYRRAMALYADVQGLPCFPVRDLTFGPCHWNQVVVLGVESGGFARHYIRVAYYRASVRWVRHEASPFHVASVLLCGLRRRDRGICTPGPPWFDSAGTLLLIVITVLRMSLSPALSPFPTPL